MASFIDPGSRVDVSGPVGEPDLVVGIPSFREADSIGHVVERVGRGLRDHFGDRRCVIANVDNASPDDTKSAFLKADSSGVSKVYVSTPPEVAGKGRNFHNLFSLVQEWKPQAVAVVDADLVSITPEWMPRLLEPILAGYDYVTPVYTRHPLDGTITNHICYPLLAGLCGLQLRQPIAGDLAFAPWLAARWLATPWRQSTCEYGIDISMTSHALFAGARLAQVPLGAKIHKPSAPKLGAMFVQVVDSLFAILSENRHRWVTNGHLGAADDLGEAVDRAPQGLDFDHEQMEAQAHRQYRALEAELASVLRPVNAEQVARAFDDGRIELSRELWMRCVYDSLGTYAGGRREAAVAALKPLYLGRVVAFVRETFGNRHTEAEAAIVEQASHFRAHREYAIEVIGAERTSRI